MFANSSLCLALLAYMVQVGGGGGVRCCNMNSLHVVAVYGFASMLAMLELYKVAWKSHCARRPVANIWAFWVKAGNGLLSACELMK